MARTDFVLHLVQGLVDETVKQVMPRGTCSATRWLTFDMEAVRDPLDDEVQECPDTFRYWAQYSASSNYVSWRIVLPGTEPHTKLDDSSSWNKPRAPWVPTASLTNKDIPDTRRSSGKAVRTDAPGFVVADGCHDSCWRDNGMTYEGLPRIDTGRTWEREDMGTSGKVFENTRYFWWPKAETVRVYSVKIEGPAGNMWGGDPEANVCDGEWVNPEPETLTGSWALLAAMASLYHCSGAEGPLELGLDSRYEYFKVTKPTDKDGLKNNRTGLTQTQSRRETQWYRFNSEGMVTHVGDSGSWNKRNLNWVEAPDGPFRLTRETHLRFLGASARKIKAGLVGLNLGSLRPR